MLDYTFLGNITLLLFLLLLEILEVKLKVATH